MVDPGLLHQVAELERPDQVELIDFLYRELDDGALDDQTKALLDERLADMEAHPDDQSDLADVMSRLEEKWL